MGLKYDELSETLNRVNSWIENCDSKVSTILSGIGVFSGILLATDYVSKFTEIFRYICEKKTVLSTMFLIISFLSFSLLLYGVFLLIRVLFARVNPKEFEGRGVKGDSLIFFLIYCQE